MSSFGPRISRAWDRTRTIPGLGRDVAVLVLLVVVGFGAAGFILANQRVDWPWQHRFEFKADFVETPGISPNNGQEVRIAGVTVGSIKAADVTDSGHARLTLSIEEGHTIYRNARLILRPKTPLNDMYVEMSAGTPGAKPLKEDGVIAVAQTDHPVQVDAVLQNLDEQTRDALSSLLDESDVALASAPQKLSGGLEATDETIKKFDPVFEALKTRREKISQLVTSLSQISTAVGGNDERLARLSTALRTTLDTVAARDGELQSSLGELPGVVDELRGATGSVTDLSKELNPTLKSVRSASEDLPPALERLTSFSDELGKTAKTARPVVAKARPIAADLRPIVGHVRSTVDDAQVLTRDLDASTKKLVSYLTDLRAFIYNTNSVVSLKDANGGILRGQAQLNLTSLPIALGGTR
ncbi:hypothetical protein ASD11_14345 [Aeromicrobium sp. Root495]|uniref:MlaD family protein n=1 Tax=Aeromicrobium sp. Root495 TaxID=1736550 RepID=UPI000700C1E4|nr:MlaD family protein [Aeromicrobium sp. Root495]KQY55691.1 hypothetical protein ASD11_14345 [Aeromicrobium sp. Root495]